MTPGTETARTIVLNTIGTKSKKQRCHRNPEQNRQMPEMPQNYIEDNTETFSKIPSGIQGARDPLVRARWLEKEPKANALAPRAIGPSWAAPNSPRAILESRRYLQGRAAAIACVRGHLGASEQDAGNAVPSPSGISLGRL